VNDILVYLKDVAGLSLPAEVAKYLIPIAAASLSFFQVQIFYALIAILILDIVTGLWKAKVLNKVASKSFGNGFNRMVYYIIIYTVMHILTISLPLGPFSVVFESLVMTGYLLKEALSVLENIKAMQTVQGQDTPIIDKIIKRLGMNLDKILTEIDESPTGKAILKAAEDEAAKVVEVTPTPATDLPADETPPANINGA